MRKMIAMILAAGAMSGFAAPTANEDFVVAEDAKTYTNAVQAAKVYTDAAIIAATNAIPSGGTSSITTNDVCAIVTNEVPRDGFTEWSFSGFPDGTTNISASFENGVLEVRFNFDGVAFYGGFSGITDATSVVLQCDDYDATVTYIITATRRRLTRNVLGLARLTDLPPLTNGLPAQIGSAVDSAMGGYLQKTNGTGTVVWDGDALNVNGATLSVGSGAISASAGTITFSGTSDGFTYNGSPVTTYQSIAPTIFAVADAGTNYTDSAIAETDTSYPRVIGITNVNQTVQYVSIDSDVPTTLSIMLPTSGDTKDWIVYVTAQTNVTINLPAATWWLADTSATNDIAPQTPTALYFSQAADDIYTLGRQEFTEVVLP